MAKRKKKPDEHAIVCSSAAEYLTFITATGSRGVEAIYSDEYIWLNLKMISTFYNVETNTVNYYLKKNFADSELEESAIIGNFRITAADGNCYDTKHYNMYCNLHFSAAVTGKIELRGEVI